MGKEPIDKERGKRLRELRINDNSRLTQLQLYKELQKIILENEGIKINDDDDNPYNNEDGGRYISKLESGHSLSLRNALAYSEYFHVSLDYIYGVSKNMKPEYKKLNEVLGLSDQAIRNLEILNKKNKSAMITLNKLLSSKLFPMFEELINNYHEHSNIDIKKHLINFPGITRIDNMPISTLYLQYINLDSKGLKNYSRENIAHCARKIADELNRFGDK